MSTNNPSPFETLTAYTTAALKMEIVNHMQMRLDAGNILILHDQMPDGFYSSIRKYWVRALARLRRQYATTTDFGYRARLREQLQRFEHVTFSQDADPEAAVIVAGPTHGPRISAECKTLYIFAAIGPRELREFARRVSPDSLVVMCTLAEKPPRARPLPRDVAWYGTAIIRPSFGDKYPRFRQN